LITEGRGTCDGGLRLPAGDIEKIVVNRLRLFLSDAGQVFDALTSHIDGPADRKRIAAQAVELTRTWADLPHVRVRALLLALVARVDIHSDQIDVHVAPGRLDHVSGGQDLRIPPASKIAERDQWLTLSVPARLRRTSMEVRLLIDGVDPYDTPAKPDPALIKLIVKAQRLHDKLVHNRGQSLDSIAAEEGIGGSYFTRVVRLAWLAPEITKAILKGRQPPGLTAEKLVRNSARLPVEWADQGQELKFE
jgi:hypothetical protein